MPAVDIRGLDQGQSVLLLMVQEAVWTPSFASVPFPPLIQWTWVWVNFGSWWWTWRPSMLQSMGSQRVGHDWATELNWTFPPKSHRGDTESPDATLTCSGLQYREKQWNRGTCCFMEWVAIPFSRGYPRPRDQTQVSCIAGRFFTIWATREALYSKQQA